MSRRAHVADVVAVLDALGVEQAVLVGQSMGGTAMLTSGQHSDRVRALVLVDTGPHDLQPGGGQSVMNWLDSWLQPLRSRAAAVRFFGGGPVGEGWADGLAEDDGGWCPRFDRDVIENMVRSDPDQDQWAEWSLVRCPALVVIGPTGIMSTERAHQMLARRPQTLAASIPGAGHGLHRERPATLAGLVRDFLVETDHARRRQVRPSCGGSTTSPRLARLSRARRRCSTR